MGNPIQFIFLDGVYIGEKANKKTSCHRRALSPQNRNEKSLQVCQWKTES